MRRKKQPKNKAFFNKKAEALKESLTFIYKAIYALFVIGLVVFLIKTVVVTGINTEKIEIYSFSQRIQNSPELFYQDTETGRVYPGIVDLKKFSEPKTEGIYEIEKNIDFPDKGKFCAKITAYYHEINDQNFVGPPAVIEKTVYINKELYDLLEPPAKAGIKGPGSGNIYTKKSPVLLVEQGKEFEGLLEIQIIRKND